MPATLTATSAASSKEPRVVELCRGSAHAKTFRPALLLQPRR